MGRDVSDKNGIKCLNPWDHQMKRIYETDGVYATLNANSGGGRTDGVCYAIEGNTVDRASNKNGRGWCENVSPTLNTQDRHAVVFRKVCKPGSDGKGERWEADEVCGTLNGFEFHSPVRTPEVVCLEGNGARPSHLGDGYSQDGKCYTLNTIERHAVCYIIDAISSNSFKSDNPHSGIHETNISKCLDTMCLNPSCNQGGVMVCYSVDGRNNRIVPEICGTLQAHNDGGWSINCTHPVLYEKDESSVD